MVRVCSRQQLWPQLVKGFLAESVLLSIRSKDTCYALAYYATCQQILWLNLQLLKAAALNTERTPVIIQWERARERLFVHVGVRLTHGKSARYNNNNMACTRLKKPLTPHLTKHSRYLGDNNVCILNLNVTCHTKNKKHYQQHANICKCAATLDSEVRQEMIEY